MTATLNGTYNSAPDTPSPVYPDRLIRPLPKRTLRSRLSSDAAESIFYPPSPAATQLFYGSCVDNGEVVNDSKVYVQQNLDTESHDETLERDPHHSYDNEVEYESGDEDGPVVVRRSAGFRGSSLSPSASSTQPHGPSVNAEGTQIKPSSAGPDGYDAFENTNNKKKRKIPTPGSLSGHPSTLSPEFSNMGLASSTPAPSSGAGDGNNAGTYYGTGNPASPVGNGISGAGRGRLGRHVARSSSGRIPLSVQTQSAWTNARTSNRHDGLLSSPGPTGDFAGKPDQGIISAAIANAAAFSSPPRGPGNVSLLEQQATTPTKTQFTFTCESDSSKGMALQAQAPYSIPHRSPTSPLSGATQHPRGMPTQGTQTSPSMAARMNQQGHTEQPQGPGTEPISTGRKKKRSPGSLYALAARQRKIQQQYSNLHHPPSMEDIWICEFCEYESIFGRPPEALIRQYEIKDRKERKRLAEKKRLLEKAKMKGRKGKKATKNANKNTAAPQGGYQHGHHRASVDHSSAGGSGAHEDDELGNDYEEESIPEPSSGALASFKTPLPPGNQPKISANTSNSKNAIDAEKNRPP
ncbi:hypothetical protein ASPWEDRAFT_278501 [Aspergillus wentii DTO 134E9]|uniref:Uncharacterized protein n=1 Tax=Aspergillus wentii DTO 134E9 TaxID=1073089 RepID=A0A1L9S3B6_ASPWE|nr:uncharacterized protein ASPWEDRAFT_278501 [Aspergillus wentii DTO 134E9]OJJ41645.1 hypothetical protein ASPWEDRAFT_278501 [Aspergillus wentii DTO 134E9]